MNSLNLYGMSGIHPCFSQGTDESYSAFMTRAAGFSLTSYSSSSSLSSCNSTDLSLRRRQYIAGNTPFIIYRPQQSSSVYPQQNIAPAENISSSLPERVGKNQEVAGSGIVRSCQRFLSCLLSCCFKTEEK